MSRRQINVSLMLMEDRFYNLRTHALGHGRNGPEREFLLSRRLKRLSFVRSNFPANSFVC